jgi:glycosyltransferase involved in cell wall biosynthesis
MKVCMFVLNNCKRDARVLKEAKTLTDAGHDVRIIAILDENTEPYEEKDGFRIIRVMRNPIHHRVLQAMVKAESFAIGLGPSLLDFFRSASHRTEPASAPSPEHNEQPSASAPPGDEPLIWRAYFRVSRSLYWALRAASQPFYRPLSLLDYRRRSWQAIKDEPADVYHSHDLTTLPMGYIAKRRTGGKLVYDSHELFTELHYISRLERPIFRLLERRLIRRADAVITVNEFAAKELSKRYGIGLPGVVMNCPPIARQGDQQYNSSLRENLGLDDAVPIIIHVGIFSRSRGSEQLVSATPFLNHGVVVFLGWGAGAEKGRLEELVRQKELEDRVLFVPPVAPEQVVGHISSAQVGVVLFRNVSLNHYYATPNKLWECMNAGLPVVSSNFPALKAIVEGYHLGKTCNPEDPEDIATAINWVLADKERYEEMKRNALKAAKIFNWENESMKLLQIYRRLSYRADDRTA